MAEHHSDDGNNHEESNEDSSDMMSLFASYYMLEEGKEETSPECGASVGISVDVHGKRREAPSTSIDSPSFDPAAHVENLLETVRADELLATDVQLVHDIRALDSDMQMLVYENYNKFIAATETIKRMKSNVEAMDADMHNVKTKMDIISSQTHVLDGTLATKNGKVEKLVRVHRLLKRLEFLTELPERLAGMIDRGEYDTAVQLYRRTNNVLTQYGHVLSFQNIQKDADRMMASLGSRILNGLDDPKLDSTQLTRFISILVSMSSPRQHIADKLIAVHRHKSLQIVKLFSANIPVGGSSSSSGAETGAAQSGPGDTSSSSGGNSSSTATATATAMLTSVAKARQFHQILVVGLIEACKGLTELFGEDPEQREQQQLQRARAPSKVGNGGASPAGKSGGSGSGSGSILMGASDTPDTAKVHASLQALQSLVSSIMFEVGKCITTVMRQFFREYSSHVHSHSSLDPSDPKIQASQLRYYELDDEKMAWVVFAEQSIAEAGFLDAALTDTTARIRKAYPLPLPDAANAGAAAGSGNTPSRFGSNSGSGSSASRRKSLSGEQSASSASASPTAPTLTLDFARAVMSVLREHIAHSTARRLQGFAVSFRKICRREIVQPLSSKEALLLLLGKEGTVFADKRFAAVMASRGADRDRDRDRDDTTSLSNSKSDQQPQQEQGQDGIFSVDASAAARVQRLNRDLTGTLDRLSELFFNTFSEVSADAQQVLGVAATLPGDLSGLLLQADSVTPQQQQQQQPAEDRSSSGGAAAAAATTGMEALLSPLQLPLVYCQQVAALFLDECTGTDRQAVMRRKQCHSVYTESWPPLPSAATTEAETEAAPARGEGDKDGTVGDVQSQQDDAVHKNVPCLLAAALLQRLSDCAAERLLRESSTSLSTITTSTATTNTTAAAAAAAAASAPAATGRLSQSSVSSGGSESQRGHRKDAHGRRTASAGDTGLVRSRISSALSTAASTLLLAAAEAIAHAGLSILLSLPILESAVSESTGGGSGSGSGSGKGNSLAPSNAVVSRQMLRVSQLLGKTVGAACAIFGDTLPPAAVRRLNTAEMNKQAAAFSAATKEQLSIERLFTQQVQVFRLPTSHHARGASQIAIEAEAGGGGGGGGGGARRGSSSRHRHALPDGDIPLTVAKALMKSLLEHMRLQRVITAEAQQQIAVDMAYFKLVCGALLTCSTGAGAGSGSADVNVLIDQISMNLKDRHISQHD